MPYVPFSQLTAKQKMPARRLRPKWQDHDFTRMQFWVKPDGDLSRRTGHHTLTEEAGAEIDSMLVLTDVRSKGDLADYKTADFSMVHS